MSYQLNQMSPLSKHNITGIHIEPTNICTLKCAGCARTQFINQWPQHWKNYQLDVDHLLQFLDIDLSGIRIVFCGNYGDPIYHGEFISLVTKIKQRGAIVQLITNGSYKSSSWWEELVSYLDSNDTITFSIDGTPDNFTTYRENADWESIKSGIDICVKASCVTEWKFIPFSFNEDSLDEVKKISISLGIDIFTVDPSSRFDKHTEWLMPNPVHIDRRYNVQIAHKKGANDMRILPQCAKNNQHFISAAGYYAPCCYVADHRFYYKTLFGKRKENFKISQTTLTKVIEDPDVIAFLNNLSHAVCAYSCGEHQ
jgi:MoaA/NifB/PqqE/SkfB family radical SAM enzyme